MSPVRTLSSSEKRETQYVLLNATGIPAQVQQATLRNRPGELVEVLLQKSWEQAIELERKQSIIQEMKIQIGELNKKINVSSIGFDLPEDYFESDEYFV